MLIILKLISLADVKKIKTDCIIERENDQKANDSLKYTCIHEGRNDFQVLLILFPNRLKQAFRDLTGFSRNPFNLTIN